MTRLTFIAVLIGAIAARAQSIADTLRNHPQSQKKKFYITGFFNSEKFNDCTVPPIIAYGTDRINALLYCCEGGGLTVWSEEEWEQFQKRGGADFKSMCEGRSR